jgi:hypothetical protein
VERLPRHPSRVLQATGGGGFRLAGESAADAIEAIPEGDGWTVRGPDKRWRLRRESDDGPGFVLEDPGSGDTADDPGAGRTSRLDRFGLSADLYYVLMGDGRLFRVGRPGPREAGYDLTGWETEGAYLVARPGSGGWRLEPTPACGGLDDITVLSILLAAEILESETVSA